MTGSVSASSRIVCLTVVSLWLRLLHTSHFVAPDPVVEQVKQHLQRLMSCAIFLIFDLLNKLGEVDLHPPRCCSFCEGQGKRIISMARLPVVVYVVFRACVLSRMDGRLILPDHSHLEELFG